MLESNRRSVGGGTRKGEGLLTKRCQDALSLETSAKEKKSLVVEGRRESHIGRRELKPFGPLPNEKALTTLGGD